MNFKHTTHDFLLEFHKWIGWHTCAMILSSSPAQAQFCKQIKHGDNRMAKQCCDDVILIYIYPIKCTSWLFGCHVGRKLQSQSGLCWWFPLNHPWNCADLWTIHAIRKIDVVGSKTTWSHDLAVYLWQPNWYLLLSTFLFAV